MKPKEYVKKWGLDVEGRRVSDGFTDDLIADLLAQVEFHKLHQFNLSIFNNIVKQFADKYGIILLMAASKPHEKTWNFIFAKVIAPMKQELFGEEIKRRKEERKEWESFRYGTGDFNFFNEAFWSSFFSKFIGGMFGRTTTKPTNEDFTLLGLKERFVEEDVKNMYRKKALEYHPDKGGDKEKFIKLTEAKNRCLMYLGSKR
jgi:hypothetical protein